MTDRGDIASIEDERLLQQMFQQTEDSTTKHLIRERLRILCEQRLLQGHQVNRNQQRNDVCITVVPPGESRPTNDINTHNDTSVIQNDGGGSKAVEEGVARTTRTEQSSDGGRTTTTTTTTSHKSKDGSHLITKQTRQITRVGGLGCTNYVINSAPAEDILQNLVQSFQSKAVPGLGGVISVRTESWNSRDGVKVQSHKFQAIDDVHQSGPTGGASSTSGRRLDVRDAPRSPQPPPRSSQLLGGGGAPERVTVQRSATSIKQVLLDWCKSRVATYKGVSVTNFSSSWADGLAFCALIHSFYPDAFDFAQLTPSDRRYNLQLAFDTAERRADITPLLEVDDMLSMSTPDWRCVFTYLQSFYRRFTAITRPRPPSDDVTRVTQP